MVVDRFRKDREARRGWSEGGESRCYCGIGAEQVFGQEE